MHSDFGHAPDPPSPTRRTHAESPHPIRVLDRVPTGAPWHLVPAGARLEDADPEDNLYWQASHLYNFFRRVRGIGPAIASKLLHLKRPGFFPILDSVMVALYAGAAGHAYGRSARAKSELPKD